MARGADVRAARARGRAGPPVMSGPAVPFLRWRRALGHGLQLVALALVVPVNYLLIWAERLGADPIQVEEDR